MAASLDELKIDRSRGRLVLDRSNRLAGSCPRPQDWPCSLAISRTASLARPGRDARDLDWHLQVAQVLEHQDESVRSFVEIAVQEGLSTSVEK